MREIEFRKRWPCALARARLLGWSKRHRGVLMAARLRARAGADDARAAASIYLARLACTARDERVRLFPFGEVLVVCRFRLDQPAVTVYKVRLSKFAAPVQQGAHKFTFQVSSTCDLALQKAYLS